MRHNPGVMRYLGFLVLFFTICSCTNGVVTELQEVDLGYSYFPLLEVGDSREYELEVKVYSNEGKNIVNQKYFQKEEVVESEGIMGIQGSYRKDIYTRDNGSFPWEYSHSQLVEMNAIQVIVHDRNDRIIHMNFPTELGKKWDGLNFVDENITKEFAGESIQFYKNWDFEITQMKGTHEGYHDLIEIRQADSENAVERRMSYEMYAEGVGLVYKNQMILDTQCLDECNRMSWEEKAHNGIILTQNLIKVN